jgi:hypothetical protein
MKVFVILVVPFRRGWAILIGLKLFSSEQAPRSNKEWGTSAKIFVWSNVFKRRRFGTNNNKLKRRKRKKTL